MQSLDLLANNLANAATSGYKRDEEFYGLFTSKDAQGDSEVPAATLPVVQNQWTDFSAGVLQETGNPLDVALAGSGFFAVNGPNGPLYTRNGSLQILPSGELATAEGYPLRSTDNQTIKVSPGIRIEISPQGVVSQNNNALGTIAVMDFKSTIPLQKMAGTTFQNTDPLNKPSPAAAPVQQGKLESSNVPVAEAAMRLVGVMRQYEMLQKAISVANEMDTKTIQEVAHVGT
jgi:flagellar basal body rod protein FlgG